MRMDRIPSMRSYIEVLDFARRDQRYSSHFPAFEMCAMAHGTKADQSRSTVTSSFRAGITIPRESALNCSEAGPSRLSHLSGYPGAQACSSSPWK
jgi:hypothetical protein